MFWVLVNEVENEMEDAILEGQLTSSVNFDFTFNDGMNIPIDYQNATFEIKIDQYALRGRMTDHLSFDEIPFFAFTKKCKDFLVGLQVKNIEYFPLKIIDEFSNIDKVELAKLKDQEIKYEHVKYENYYIANVTGLIDCINHKASNVEYYVDPPVITDDMPEEMKEALQQEEDKDIDFIRKLVLDESKIPEDIKIFRLKDCPRILVFKEEVVKAIREEGLTGFVFIPLEEYTDEIPDDDEEENENTIASSKEKEATPGRNKIIIKRKVNN